jgi:predicted amidohydrolase
MAQMTSARTHAANIAFVSKSAEIAKSQGCEFLALPEVAGLLNSDVEELRCHVTPPASDPYVLACCDLAARYGLWIHNGSTPVAGVDGRLLNHSSLINSEGQIVASYSKIHLFDVFLNGQKASAESERYAPGKQAVLADTPWGQIGMSICYDLRFPHLYRDYARAGAGIMFVPSAFTVPTGQAHWEVLLRARAIENSAFVIAPAQVGQHDDGRSTYGHSMVVGPWGSVLADMGTEPPGLRMLALDLTEIDSARQQIPSLVNERPYEFSSV